MSFPDGPQGSRAVPAPDAATSSRRELNCTASLSGRLYEVILEILHKLVPRLAEIAALPAAVLGRVPHVDDSATRS